MPRHPEVAATAHGMPGSVYSALAHRLETFDGEVYPLHVGDTWMEPAAGCRMQDLTIEEFPGMHRYAPPQGLPALLEAIAAEHQSATGVPTSRAEVLVAAGATGALGAVAGAVFDPGDEVLLLAPYWPLISGIVLAAGAQPVVVPFFEDGRTPDDPIERLERSFGRRTVALYFNSPNNPTGAALSDDVLAELAAWAAARDLWVLADEVYEHYLYTGEHAYARPHAPERTFSTHSFSKAFGMAGNRCGYVVGPAPAMGELRKISTHTFYSTPTASQLAALRALENGRGREWARAARETYREVGVAAATRLGLPSPEGSTFLFLDIADRLDEGGMMTFLERAVDRGLFAAPGGSFGPYDTHVRICFTSAPPDVVGRGVEVLAELLGR